MNRIFDLLLSLPQIIAPQRTLSRFAGWIARRETKWLRYLTIRGFMRYYRVDLSEARRGHWHMYRSFNDFFTRELRPGLRRCTADEDALISPCDGVITEFGVIEKSQLLQAKGRSYSLNALAAGDAAIRQRFQDGSFATIYLAPQNYHRVHTPLGGTVRRVIYVPGRLYSVNRRTTSAIDALFTKNERVLVELETNGASVVIILIGAMLVGSIELSFCDVARALIEQRGSQAPFEVQLPVSGQALARGSELGRFNMGSTVVLLVEPGFAKWDRSLHTDQAILVGQQLATTARILHDEQ